MSIENVKKALGVAAADMIEDGMLVGLGTGSTANYFIDALAVRVQQGLEIQALPSSEASKVLAEEGEIPLLKWDTVDRLDITVDGADEVDCQFGLIKGGGGALLREKIIAQASDHFVIIVDEHKMVNSFNQHPLPLEVIPFAYRSTLRQIRDMGLSGELRIEDDGTPFFTDNGNYIFDVSTSGEMENMENMHSILIALTGVVDTGLFMNMVDTLIVGYDDGRIEHLKRKELV